MHQIVVENLKNQRADTLILTQLDNYSKIEEVAFMSAFSAIFSFIQFICRLSMYDFDEMTGREFYRTSETLYSG